MSTRLDRLFCLLQDGQNPLVRETAAQQIGEICKTDVSKADVLLERVEYIILLFPFPMSSLPQHKSRQNPPMVDCFHSVINCSFPMNGNPVLQQVK